MAAQEDVANLRTAVMRYKTIDDQIRELNSRVYPLREQRKITELEIVDIIRQPAFATYEKLDIREDGSSIRIRKPQTWSAPWSLSKRKMQTLLEQYWSDQNTIKSFTSCYRFMVRAVEGDLRKDSYAIERVVPGADE